MEVKLGKTKIPSRNVRTYNQYPLSYHALDLATFKKTERYKIFIF
jgi:hypothetical protein